MQLQIHRPPVDLLRVGSFSVKESIVEEDDEEKEMGGDEVQSVSENSDDPDMSSSHCSSELDDFSRRIDLSSQRKVNRDSSVGRSLFGRAKPTGCKMHFEGEADL